MTEMLKTLPLGVENFTEIINNNLYYVDKTPLIRDILQDGAKITLFTRPRRFGKTLMMSMLRSFFEAGTDPALFDGLAIADEKVLCKQYLGKYPVISVSLCKYRMHHANCTDKTCHLNGKNRPHSRMTIPSLLDVSRRSFSTAIAARSAGFSLW